MRNLIRMSMFLSLAMFVFSCDNDDDNNDPVVPTLDIPETYDFTRNGESTVSFGGQVTRLSQSELLYDAFNVETSLEDLNAMFNGVEGPDGQESAGFSDDDLNGTTKIIGQKTSNSTLQGSGVDKGYFDSMIEEYANVVVPAFNDDAVAGAPGYVTGASGSSYRLNAAGQELDQLFFKGLIGAFTLDQIVNNYLHPNQLDTGENMANNDNDVLDGDSNYTKMEHKWDEGFGYLYGHLDAEDNGEDLATAGSAPSGNGDLLMKYFKKVDSGAQPGIGQTVYDAFIAGRTAIVNKDYAERDAQADIIQVELSKVIGYYALYYMNDYVAKLGNGDVGGAHHSLSEAWGFLFSLKYTNDGMDETFMIEGGVPSLDHFLGVNLIPNAPEYMSDFHGMADKLYALTAPYNGDNPSQSGMIVLVENAFADKGHPLN